MLPFALSDDHGKENSSPHTSTRWHWRNFGKSPAAAKHFFDQTLRTLETEGKKIFRITVSITVKFSVSLHLIFSIVHQYSDNRGLFAQYFELHFCPRHLMLR